MPRRSADHPGDHPDGHPDDLTGGAPRGARGTLAVASFAVLLAAADTYVVVLALPQMMLGAGVGIDELQRATPIVTAFLLGYVATLPLIGRLADLRGVRPVLLGCLLLFALGCLLTATATSLGPLVVGRAVQGIGGGGLVPATLALVAATWPAERRGTPLGVVGAVQEAGAAIGPLLGAAVLAVADWRWIFWLNLLGAAVLAAVLERAVVQDRTAAAGQAGDTTGPTGAAKGVDGVTVAAGVRGADRITWLVAALATAATALLLIAPARLVGDVRWGTLWAPLLDGSRWTSPLAAVAAVAGLLATARWAVRAGLRRLLDEVDAVGSALLAGALACLVVAFATADPERAAVSDRAPELLALTVVLLLAFGWRQRRARHPLVPRDSLRAAPAWGSLLTNLPVGAALVTALVDIPFFARSTTQPDSQLGAALVLLRLLVAVPLGALAGGWLIRRLPPWQVAAGGMAAAAVGLAAMTRWTEDTLTGAGGTVELVLTGLGFGLAIAPVNAALLAATEPAVHGIASALVVVCRMVGMLAGLSALTALGLRFFYREQARIGSPFTLCPQTPTDCPAYDTATKAALLGELHAIFAGAAGCAALAAVLAALLLRGTPRGTPADGRALFSTAA